MTTLKPLAALTGLVLVLAACGSGDDGSGDEGATTAGGAGDPDMDPVTGQCPEPEQSSITLGNIPMLATTLPHVAQEEGYFEEAGLEVEQQTGGGGAELLPALQAGELDVVYSNVLSPLMARDEGFDFMLILDDGQVPAEPPDSLPLMVPADSPLQEPGDLAGGRIAVNNVGSIAHLFLLEYLEMNDVDPASVDFVEAPFPTMIDGLVQDQYDAAAVVEPVRSIGMQAGDVREFDNYFSRVNPDFNIAGWVSTESWISENPGTACAFIEAMEKARHLVLEDEQAWREYAVEWAELDEQLLDEVIQEVRAGVLHLPSLQRTVDLAAKHGFLSESYDVEEAVWVHAPTEPALD